MLDAEIDEGFLAIGNYDLTNAFDNFSPSGGTTTTYTFESTNEGFSFSGNASYETHFNYSPSDGTDDTFTFESDSEGFSTSGDTCGVEYTFDAPMRTTADCT